MSEKIGYVWHLRRLMAERGLFATTELRPQLAERGVILSREQVYRLVVRTPERLSLATLAALCDILGCGPGDLVEPVAGARPPGCAAGAAGAAAPAPGGGTARAGAVEVAGGCASGMSAAAGTGGPARPAAGIW